MALISTGSGGGGTPGGSTTQVQYNNAGAFGGTSGWTWDGSHWTLATNQEARFRASTNRVYSDAADSLTVEGNVTTKIGKVGDTILGDGTLRVMYPQTTEKIDLGKSANRFFNAFFGGDIDLDNSSNLILGTGAGTKFGTGTTQKMGFFNATPTAQIAGTVDLLASLVTLGFRAASSNPPLDIGTGALTCGTITTNLATLGYNLTSYAAGTAYALTATPAQLNFGTTDPSVTIDKAGTYLIMGRCQLKYNAATFAANRTTTIKLRRTNNTAADLTNGTVTAATRIITTITDTFVDQTWPVIYTTANANDIIQIFGSIDVVPTAGSCDAVAASIVCVRLF